MPSQYNEQALESLIEKALTGYISEELRSSTANCNELGEDVVPPLSGKGYYIGNPGRYDKKYALDTEHFWNFLESSQPKELEKIKRSADWKLRILERYDRMVKKYGVLRLLKKGLDVDDAQFVLFYEWPGSGSAQSVKDNFEHNEFSVTRQLRYSQVNALEEVDMVLFINGIPLITAELKNAWTGQTAAVHGIHQYKKTRDFNQPLFQFGRCLVHFTADADEVYMTTRLQGNDTFFLPFNKGDHFGKGNPVNPNGHKTAYLWEEVFSKKSLSLIIQHFVLLEGKESDPLAKKSLIFPRYHQLEVVNELLTDVQIKGIGHTYLIQHSAGSGKSHSITWTAFQLIELEDAAGHTLFDSVIVVTDRRVLDKQLRDNIKSFSVIKNIIGAALTSADLKAALENGKRIIITTIQKFPIVIKDIDDMAGKRFAVIIDEAHSSQGGIAADKMNQVIGKLEENEEGEIDAQDMILQAMASRKMRKNASYFAFTATPKNSTLERFGNKQEDGTFRPFHLYSMKQAIEEGFILDVLANYTTYKSYYQLEKSVADNPEFNTKKAQKALKVYVERDERTIKAKSEIMLEHFIHQVFDKKKLKNKAKGMVVTQSIESAIRYYQAIRALLEAKGRPFEIIVAFSGKKEVDGIEYTEALINGFPDTDTKDKFDEDQYRLLIVANKYLTGFDQPKLTAMYVDKKLQGVLCVQALSRLNRSAPRYGKRTEDLFVLDFYNESADIKKSFDPFYTATSLTEATDINVLHELKDALDDAGIYEWEEVERFNTLFFQNVNAEQLSPIIGEAAGRFNAELNLSEERKADLKIKAKHFVKIYGQVAAIIPFENIRWEKLFWFLKFLIPYLKVKDKEKDALDGLLNAVDLSTYGLERKRLNEHIVLDATESVLPGVNANPRSAHTVDERSELDKIISTFNERWFGAWGSTAEEGREKFLNFTQKIQDHPDYQSKFVENKDEYTRQIAYETIVSEVIYAMRRKEIEFFKQWLNDEDFRRISIQQSQRFLR